LIRLHGVSEQELGGVGGYASTECDLLDRRWWWRMSLKACCGLMAQNTADRMVGRHSTLLSRASPPPRGLLALFRSRVSLSRRCDVTNFHVQAHFGQTIKPSSHPRSTARRCCSPNPDPQACRAAECFPLSSFRRNNLIIPPRRLPSRYGSRLSRDVVVFIVRR
jgi:hypothetical protein